MSVWLWVSVLSCLCARACLRHDAPWFVLCENTPICGTMFPLNLSAWVCRVPCGCRCSTISADNSCACVPASMGHGLQLLGHVLQCALAWLRHWVRNDVKYCICFVCLLLTSLSFTTPNSCMKSTISVFVIVKVARSSVFWRSTNLESKLIKLFVFVKF